MKLNYVTFCTALVVLVAGAGCSKSPVQPTGTVSTTRPGTAQMSPADGAQIPYYSQPVTLTITNAVTTGSDARTYIFEIAKDSGFGNIVVTKSGVAEGSSGRTSITLDTLSPSTTYYWRSRVRVGSNEGLNSGARSFAVGAQVILGKPVLSSPVANGTVTGQAALSIANVSRTGPIQQISYQFQVSDSSSFGTIVFDKTVKEQSGGQTQVTVDVALNNQATYYWRVKASESGTGVTSAFSDTSSFQYIAFDMRQAVIWNNPPDLGSWPETAHITLADTGGWFIVVDFDKRDGPNRWPDDYTPGWDGALQYTLGMCLSIQQRWNCSAVVQFWYGRELEEGGVTSEVGINWFYDNRWGALMGRQPAWGETVGLFVGAGNLRDNGHVGLQERSNVVLIPWGSTYSWSPTSGTSSSQFNPLRLVKH
jgi:hypothetical protein